MPELPEVETTRRGIATHLLGRQVEAVRIRQPRLRYPVPPTLARELPGHTITAVERRAKYLLLRSDAGSLIIHLGMSGSLRLVDADAPADKHDHADLVLDDGRCLRLRDPRRFGCLLWTHGEPEHHRLLKDLGCEPLGPKLSGEALFRLSRGRRISVKAFIMDSHVVVGVGNIYASEALFRAGIHPQRAAGRVSAERYEQLAAAIREVLKAAIRRGGTTLRDFTGGDGRPGYFKQRLNVYDRAGEPCLSCGTPIAQRVIAQRASYYCKQCQH